MRKKSYYIFGESSPWEALSRKSGLTKRRFRRDMAKRNLKIAIFGRMFRAKYERFPRFFRHRVQDLNVISPPREEKIKIGVHTAHIELLNFHERTVLSARTREATL